ncbi:MAG: hypothetical protein MUF84_05270 [Anaerolineae bacterium]|nr:hypothetical protein [Anaerolineae bacterium]
MTADTSTARWEWLLLALLTATLASLARWAIGQPAVTRSRFGPMLGAIGRSTWLVHPLRLIHALGIPACALFWQHALSAKALGLKPLPRLVPPPTGGVDPAPGLAVWANDAGALVLIAGALAGIVALGDRVARHRVRSPRTPIALRDWAVAIREGVIHQVRWAFYREPFVFIWGPAVGSWFGATPAILEAIVSPTFWRSLRGGHPANARATVVRAGFLVGSTMLYLATQNLWMAILANVVLEGLLLPTTSSPPPETQ